MLSTERQRFILDEVARKGRVVTSEAAARLGVSEVTVRTDLDVLEQKGRVRRTHGGAVSVDAMAAIVGFDTRMSIRREAKRRIALEAAKYISSGRSVIFDAGTTMMHLAQVVPEVSDLTVYTPGVPIAQQLLTLEGVDVHLLGGRLDERWLETVGSPREQGIEDLLVHTLFLGAHGVDDDLDIVDQSVDLASNKIQLARCARSVVLLADSAKWNATARTKVMALGGVDVVITDDGLDDGTRARIESLDVELVIA